MTTLAIGDVPEDFNWSGFRLAGTSATYRVAHASHHMKVTRTEPATITLDSVSSNVWFSSYAHIGSNSTYAAGYLFKFHGPNGQPIIGLRGGAANNNLDIVVANNNSWVAGSTVSFGTIAGRIVRLDINVVVSDSSGKVSLYINGDHIGSYLGNTLQNGQPVIGQIELGTYMASGDVYHSNIWITDSVDTRGLIALPCDPSAAGNAQQQNSGTFADINGSNPDEASYVGMTVENSLALFQTTPAAAAYSGYTVDRVVTINRSFSMPASPVKTLTTALRTNGANHFGASIATERDSKILVQDFLTNPATASAWTFAEADAAEIGFKANT